MDMRKKSPRAPALSLSDALEKALAIYGVEARHSVSREVIAQDCGYKDANGGAARSALGALKAYGLLQNAASGMLAVSKDVEDYKFSPDSNTKRTLLQKWVSSPKIYAHFFDRFKGNLPSKGALRYEMIQMGFLPQGVDRAVDLFFESVNFAGIYSEASTDIFPRDETNVQEQASPFEADISTSKIDERPVSVKIPNESIVAHQNVDRIPIRLTGNRRAWIEIPMPFFEKDKIVLKNQIDLIVVDEAE